MKQCFGDANQELRFQLVPSAADGKLSQLESRVQAPSAKRTFDCYAVGRSGPNLKPGTVCVCGMNGMNTAQHPPSPAARAGPDLPTNVQAVSRAVSDVNTHQPRFQIRARPS